MTIGACSYLEHQEEAKRDGNTLVALLLAPFSSVTCLSLWHGATYIKGGSLEMPSQMYPGLHLLILNLVRLETKISCHTQQINFRSYIFLLCYPQWLWQGKKETWVLFSELSYFL